VLTECGVDVSVPDGAYAVDAKAGSGDVNVDVHVDARSPRQIVAQASSGDIHIEPHP
jgi:hypothetical protein